jgi:hypothetical protein
MVAGASRDVLTDLLKNAETPEVVGLRRISRGCSLAMLAIGLWAELVWMASWVSHIEFSVGPQSPDAEPNDSSVCPFRPSWLDGEVPRHTCDTE